ncbi:MAG TPA: hypothetical protein PLS49_07285, partial [Candidatus Woesebacteria bacterium]|nr:hypothetical protein [Candidatus Woesebacteria bacterium]
VPHSFTAAGDVSMANDLVFTNQTAANIISNGPLTIQSGESFENLDLILKPSGNGSVVIDAGNSLELFDSGNLVFDANDGSDTYFNFDNPNNRLELFIDGTEGVRFTSTGAIDANAAVTGNAFDLAEKYPTMNTELEAGDIVVVADASSTEGANYLVDKSNNENKDKVLGVVSTKPGFILGGGSFYSDFCADVQAGGTRADQAIAKAVKAAKAEAGIFSEQFDSTVATGEASLSISEQNALEATVHDKVAACRATRQIPVALSGRVPVKVDVSKGDIKAGDLLAVSTKEPGKATKATENGWVIGRALEDSKTNKETVMMFVDLVWYTGKELAQQVDLGSVDNASLDIDLALDEVMDIEKVNGKFKSTIFGDLSILGNATANNITSLGEINAGLVKIDGKNNAINVIGGGTLKLQAGMNAGNIEAFGGKLIMTSEGSLIAEGTLRAQKVVAEEFAVLGKTTINEKTATTSAALDATIGEGTIKAGSTAVSIPNTHVTPGAKIFVTANTDTNGQGLVVAEKKNGLFKVTLKDTLTTDVKFDYWIVKVE